MADDPSQALPGEVITSQTDTSEGDAIRRVVADVYTFVRSREVNKSISSFTFDHYIDERKRAIQGQRILQSATNPGQGLGTRPSQLDALSKLEDDFNKGFDKAKKIAEQANKSVT